MASSPLAPGLENAWDAQVQLPTGVHVWMSTRQGGVSRAPWDSLNLGEHVGDAPEAVAGNRARLQQALGARPVFLRQVHGTDVLELGPETVAGQADACFTFATGVACTIQVADCLPVLLWDRQGQWVAAAHAGWLDVRPVVAVGAVLPRQRIDTVSSTARSACTTPCVSGWRTSTKPSPS